MRCSFSYKSFARLIFAASVAALISTSTIAKELVPGDILVAEYFNRSIVHVSPQTGAQTLLFKGSPGRPVNIAIGLNDEIFVTDINYDAVMRLDPETGDYSLVTPNLQLQDPLGLVVAADGLLYVTESRGNRVVRVDPATGSITPVSSGGELDYPFGIAIDAQGYLIVNNIRNASVISINPATGAQTIVSAGGSLRSPANLVIEQDGSLVVTDQGANSLIRIDPRSGAQSVLINRGPFLRPSGIALEADGTLVVGDWFTRTVMRVNPEDASSSILSSGGLFSGIEGVAVVPYPADMDNDGDGVLDDEDECPESVLGDELRVNLCLTGIANPVSELGCSVADYLDDCSKRRGHFNMQCVARLSHDLVAAELLDRVEGGALISAASGASCR
jgi:streptogramin lyase